MDDTEDLGYSIAEMAQRLEARRRELEHDSQAGKAVRDAVELDQTRVGRLSRMDAMQQQAISQESERLRTVEIQRIGSALKRIDSGDYGYCILCDEAIAPARLDLDPSLLTCVECARKRG